MKFSQLSKVAFGVALSLSCATAFSAVTADEAKVLGTTLTPMGADPKGNADGTIPAYTGGLTKPPAGYKNDDVRINPFAGEKPRLVITKDNYKQFEAKLTHASRELFARFPDFRMNVYATQRTASFPKVVLDNSIKNATKAKTVENGLGVADVLPGTPFPIPKTGEEAMWNHLLRYTTSGFKYKYDVMNVDRSGTASLSTTADIVQEWPSYTTEKINTPLSPSDVYFQVKVNYTAPARRAGEAIIVKDYVDPINNKRRAWQYLPGQRRVKEAPDVAYDTPNPGNSGAATYDDAFAYNGAMDRYTWKLKGKTEMIVPYNAYDWVYSKKTDNFTTPNFPNPDRVRWELHRVWVVEATLKEGSRHVYAKRVFYLDEDTWFAMAADNYDARGNMFRATMNSVTQAYDVGVSILAGQWHHDFNANVYSVSGIHTADYYGIKFHGNLRDIEWAPQSLSSSGVR
jgi:hypothetical protein